MSRFLFLMGLLVSAALHVWLLQIPAHDPPALPPIVVVPVVETELAAIKPKPEPVEIAQAEPPQQPVAEPPPPEPKPEPEPPQPETPQPKLVKVAEPEPTAVKEQGDMAGVADDDPDARDPELRIDWGTRSEALAALDASGMLIVVLNGHRPQPVIKQQIEEHEGAWRRRPYQPAGAVMYSNRLRIVDHVPAFDEVRSTAGLGPDERLAVLVPMKVERVLESAKMRAAFDHGLAMRQIDNFAGRFSLRDGALDFDITHVGQAGRSATQ